MTTRHVYERATRRQQISTQSREWCGFYFIDRDSDLLNEDGSRYPLDPDTSAALQANLGSVNARQLNAFLQELMPELGIASMEDLPPGVPLEAILEGILGD